MIPLVTTQSIRNLDLAATKGDPQAGFTLMLQAGHALARCIVELQAKHNLARVVFLCGKGHNGGDGLVAAVELSRSGVDADVFTMQAPPDDSADSVLKRTWNYFHQAHLKSKCWSFEHLPKGPFLVVDCVLGTGARSGHSNHPMIKWLAGFAGVVLQADFPSVLVLEEHDLQKRQGLFYTLEFGMRRIESLYPNQSVSYGKIYGASLEYKLPSNNEYAPAVAYLHEPKDVSQTLPTPPVGCDKRSRGVLWAGVGSLGMWGAQKYVVDAAYACGCGLVKVGSPASEAKHILTPQAVHSDLVPEAMVQNPNEVLKGCNAFVLGPGMGNVAGAWVRDWFLQAPIPGVFDADALNALAYTGGVPQNMGAMRVLTPHLREAKRLWPEIPSTWKERLDWCKQIAQSLHIVLVLKDQPVICALPNGKCFVYPYANPALAKAGTGDVLSGLLGALLAQEQTLESVLNGVWLHCACGVEAAHLKGVFSVEPKDITRQLPKVLFKLGVAAMPVHLEDNLWNPN